MKPYYSEGGITIYHGDCRELREQIELLALRYHKDTEGEYGCPGQTCPGVQRLIEFAASVALAALESAVQREQALREALERIATQRRYTFDGEPAPQAPYEQPNVIARRALAVAGVPQGEPR